MDQQPRDPGLIHQKVLLQRSENLAMKALVLSWAGASAVVLLLNHFLNGNSDLAITGIPSIGFYTLVLGAIFSFAGFTLGYFASVKNFAHPASIKRSRLVRRLINGLTIGLAYATIFAGLSLAVTYGSARIIGSLTFDQYISALIIGSWCGIITYAMTKLSLRVNPRQIANLLMVFMVGGVLVSMFTTKNPLWWQKNFSKLGEYTQAHTSAYYVFNLTFIVSALLMFVLGYHLLASIDEIVSETTKNRRLRIGVARTLLVLMALGMLGVGAVPLHENSIYYYFHFYSAQLVVFCFLALIALIRWLIPTLSHTFLVVSYLSVGLLATIYVLYSRLGYFNITAAELTGFIIAFGWLYLFLNQITILTDASDPY